MLGVVLDSGKPQLRVFARHPDGRVATERTNIEGVWYARSLAMERQELALRWGERVVWQAGRLRGLQRVLQSYGIRPRRWARVREGIRVNSSPAVVVLVDVAGPVDFGHPGAVMEKRYAWL